MEHIPLEYTAELLERRCGSRPVASKGAAWLHENGIRHYTSCRTFVPRTKSHTSCRIASSLFMIAATTVSADALSGSKRAVGIASALAHSSSLKTPCLNS